jgi:putative heme iron utilization protein
MNAAEKEVAPAFSPVQAAKRVLRITSVGALGTIDTDGGPFTSLVTTATTPAGEPILLISRLAVHTQNLARDDRASLLLVEPGGERGDPLAGARLTVKGRARQADHDPALARRFLSHHPEAARYASFADFSFWMITVEKAHLVAGFGRIVSIPSEKLLTDCTGADDLLLHEEGLLTDLNRDRLQSIVRSAGGGDDYWRAVSLDPDGLDLTCGTRAERYPFHSRVTTSSALAKELDELGPAIRG